MNMKKLFYLFILLSMLLMSEGVVSAATAQIYLTGPTGALAPGSILTAGVYLDTDTAINALDLEVSFPKARLESLDFDNTNSIVDIWQNSPRILPNGNISLSGGLLRSWSGKKGLIMKLQFKVLGAGSVKLSFEKSNLYLADGQGTLLNIQPSSLTFQIKENAPVVSVPVVPFQSTPSDITIQNELQVYKSNILLKRTIFWFLGIIIIVFAGIWVYNKRKRNQ